MTNLNKIIPLSLLALLALSACSNPLSKNEFPDRGALPVVTEEKAVMTEENTPVAADDAVVEDFRTSAFAKGYSCNNLKDAASRQDCEMQVADTIGNMLQSEIIDSYDVKRCKELPEEIAANCEQHLTATGVQGPVTPEEVSMFNEAVRGMMPEITEDEEPVNLYPIYDKTKCAELKTPGYKGYCENKIMDRMDQNMMDEIFRSDKSTRCGELALEKNKLTCEQFFGIAVEPVVEEPVVAEPVMEEVPAEIPSGNTEVVQ